jgi:hypothetical protein
MKERVMGQGSWVTSQSKTTVAGSDALGVVRGFRLGYLTRNTQLVTRNGVCGRGHNNE